AVTGPSRRCPPTTPGPAARPPAHATAGGPVPRCARGRPSSRRTATWSSCRCGRRSCSSPRRAAGSTPPTPAPPRRCSSCSTRWRSATASPSPSTGSTGPRRATRWPRSRRRPASLSTGSTGRRPATPWPGRRGPATRTTATAPRPASPPRDGPARDSLTSDTPSETRRGDDMLDLIIRGATIVDGTGAPGRRGDVGVAGGRIAAVVHRDDEPAGLDEPATEELDADGLVVCPGFVDPHTHYDAQLFWDPLASPSNVHGVTTIIAGNCGFTLAPLRPDDADYLRRMMAKGEGMPLAALEEGRGWSWETFEEYRDRLDGRIGVNAGFMVGHCALRRYVMGADAIDNEASPEQVAAMVDLLHTSIEAGGLGFSTTLSSTHSDGDGNPVASRHAGRDELLALCAAVGAHEGTFLEGAFEGGLDRFSDEEIELIAAMSAAAGRPINWNVLTVDSSVPDRVPRQLRASDRAAELGGRVVALTMPVLVPMNMSFGSFCALWLMPGWGEVMRL